jgi:hypothetical protein
VKWLFLVHQIGTRNSRERVRVWRLIKKVGAELYRNSVYVLPYSKERLEDFQWACQQIRDSQGEASVYVSKAQDPKEDRLLQSLFLKSREENYLRLLEDSKKLLDRVQRSKQANRFTFGLKKLVQKELKQIRERLEETNKIDFFRKSPPGELRQILETLQKLLTDEHQDLQSLPLRRQSIKAFQGKTWATRENIHIDRIASAWLILRFIDPKAKFVFAPEGKLPTLAIPFDVFGAELSHHGEDCTFETLLGSFGLRDRGLKSIAEIVHDVDLKDHMFERAEASGLDTVIRSLALKLQDDHKLLQTCLEIFDALYRRYSLKAKSKRKNN